MIHAPVRFADVCVSPARHGRNSSRIRRTITASKSEHLNVAAMSPSVRWGCSSISLRTRAASGWCAASRAVPPPTEI